MRRLLRRLILPSQSVRPADEPTQPSGLVSVDLPIPYSWVLTRHLAVGPMPSSPAHWQQLEQAGLLARFSCCYPQEEELAPPLPPHWLSDAVPLPDHRIQEPLRRDRLAEALQRLEHLLDAGAPVYLHCLAGMQRSPLLAVGLIARERNLSLFEALDWVRRCHPPAQPLVSHMAVLEQLLAQA